MANVASLPIMLKELKLAGFTQHWEELAQKALDDQWLPQQYLAELCAEETAARHHRRLQRYLRESQLASTIVGIVKLAKTIEMIIIRYLICTILSKFYTYRFYIKISLNLLVSIVNFTI